MAWHCKIKHGCICWGCRILFATLHVGLVVLLTRHRFPVRSRSKYLQSLVVLDLMSFNAHARTQDSTYPQTCPKMQYLGAKDAPIQPGASFSTEIGQADNWSVESLESALLRFAWFNLDWIILIENVHRNTLKNKPNMLDLLFVFNGLMFVWWLSTDSGGSRLPGNVLNIGTLWRMKPGCCERPFPRHETVFYLWRWPNEHSCHLQLQLL